MHRPTVEQVKLKSKRVIPPAHWPDENTEHLLLLIWEEIKRHPNTFEQKSTAQQFYFKISEKCPQFETTNWVSMKNKLENCKIHYRRTRNLLGKADNTTDTDYLEKLCPFYGLLDRIFRGNLKPTSMNFFAKLAVRNKASDGCSREPEVATDDHEHETMESTAQSSPSRIKNHPPSPLFAGKPLSLSMPDLHNPGTEFKTPNLEPAFELTQSTVGCLISLLLEETEKHPDTLEKLAEEAFYKNISANCSRLKKADWMILKNKVESLKNSYINARLRRKEYGDVTSTDENAKAIAEPADPTCPCYEILDKIFGPGLENSNASAHPTANDITNERELKATNPWYSEMSNKSNKDIYLVPSDCEQAASKARSMPNISIIIKSPNETPQPYREKSTEEILYKTFSTNSISKKGATTESPQTTSSGETKPCERVSADAAFQNGSDEIVSGKSTITSERLNEVSHYELVDPSFDSKQRNVNFDDEPVANNETSYVSNIEGPLTQNHRPTNISMKAFSMPNMPITKRKSYNLASALPSPAVQKVYKRILSNCPELKKTKWIAIERQKENFHKMWKRQAGAGMISDIITRETGTHLLTNLTFQCCSRTSSLNFSSYFELCVISFNGYRNQACPLYDVLDKIYGSDSEEKVINIVKFRNRSNTSDNTSEDEMRRAEYSSNEEFNENPLSPEDSDAATYRGFSMPNMHILRSGEQAQIHSESSFGLTDNSLSHRESEVSSTATSPKAHSSLAQVIDKNIYIRSLVYETRKLEVEHEKLRLEQKKFEWQQEREGTELKLKQKEIDHDFELKKIELDKLERMEKAKMKLQLDHEERMKKYEIQMKLQNFGGL
uniref:Uncharacterized protein n=1 Tax=Glossina austeni TaxID=7395 RepID=A0A1A9VGE2_GLOAU